MTGGGTLGPVTPLLGIAEEWKKQNSMVHVAWVGTPNGPEKQVVEEYGYDFFPLRAPKLSRHKWWTWSIILPLFILSFTRAFRLLKRERPSIIFSAGGYVSVPVVFAGRLLGIPSWIHQLDAVPGLANRLMSYVATRVSLTWQEIPAAYEKNDPVYVGSVIRNELRNGNGERMRNAFGFSKEKPTLLIFGGGTGASSINQLLEVIGEKIAQEANVIHITGRGKMLPGLQNIAKNYIALEFAGKEMADYLDLADMVIGRAGMGTILEICALRKPSLLIPLHNADQLANAKAFQEAKAGKVLWELNGQILLQETLKFIENEEDREMYRRNCSMLFKEYGEQVVVEKAQQLLEEK